MYYLHILPEQNTLHYPEMQVQEQQKKNQEPTQASYVRHSHDPKLHEPPRQATNQVLYKNRCIYHMNMDRSPEIFYREDVISHSICYPVKEGMHFG